MEWETKKNEKKGKEKKKYRRHTLEAQRLLSTQ
jgi:hypothetical protein